MKRVFKYPIGPQHVGDYRYTAMHEGAKILSCQMQDEQITLWALVDTEKPLVDRHFRMAGTGHQIDDEIIAHVGTLQCGPFVWHLFEIEER